MAQDLEGPEDPLLSTNVTLSHESDMVPLFESMTTDAELDANNIVAILESNGIHALLNDSPIRSLGLTVLVAQADLERARSLIAEALAAGPEAAADGEAASELP